MHNNKYCIGIGFKLICSVRDADDAVYGRDGSDYDGSGLRVEFPRSRSRGSRRGFGGIGLPQSGSWQDLKDHREDVTDAVRRPDNTKSRSHEASSSSTMTDRKAVIKNADMSEDMQQDAVDCATQAMEKYNIEKDIAAYIKKEFDKKYNPTWHCIVGRNFGSYVTHETKHFIYFYLGQVAILLFKSG
ncbi:Dynein light chain 2, cytoplasmic [Liparis tanakae]|uniref:Dynein light chain 2, cytoplasmic n=1 Tax=Liparis tanakae TaxID=230148 RepID=A0A4Z2HMN7_9TELE|nr:Dynein light chain 2, cytoplasmic [Liparis tanakae]